YVQAIHKHHYPIEALTTKRIKNDYHDEDIANTIASASSIRKEIELYGLSDKVKQTIPPATLAALMTYRDQANRWHGWELYFSLAQYQILSKSEQELKDIQGVDEGLEYRLKHTVLQATSFQHWMELMKTKRYTRTRLQRMFVHILTNTTKQEINTFLNATEIPYVRLLGLSQT